jgi:4-methylaminobutanoate oxidase (formaldehyde-forming)
MVRVTFVGELGWEIYCPAEYGAGLWRHLWRAGQAHGLVAAGYRAIDSLRLEKGYRVWAADLDPAHTPYEAGLDFCVKLDKPGGFAGRDALVAQRESGVPVTLACLVLDDARTVVSGNEPVRVGDTVLGRVTSGGQGWAADASIAYCYLPVEAGKPGQRVSVGVFGSWVGATVAATPLVDPTGERIRADSVST